jgi:hypothetical protein
MKRYFIVFSLFLISCSSKTGTDLPSVRECLSVDSIFKGNFFLDSPTCIDSNAFFFLKEKRWDTSYVLTMHKYPSRIKCIYHEISPENMEMSYLQQGVNVFNGFTFEIDSVTWQEVITSSTALLDSVNHTIDHGCVDCHSFLLAHNFTFTRNSVKNKNDFEKYSKYLRKKLIYPILSRNREFANAK